MLEIFLIIIIIALLIYVVRLGRDKDRYEEALKREQAVSEELYNTLLEMKKKQSPEPKKKGKKK